MNTHPKRVNNNHFSTEKFPDVIAFCDRVENSHIHGGQEESYSYALNEYTKNILLKNLQDNGNLRNMIIIRSSGSQPEEILGSS